MVNKTVNKPALNLKVVGAWGNGVRKAGGVRKGWCAVKRTGAGVYWSGVGSSNEGARSAALRCQLSSPGQWWEPNRPAEREVGVMQSWKAEGNKWAGRMSRPG